MGFPLDTFTSTWVVVCFRTSCFQPENQESRFRRAELSRQTVDYGIPNTPRMGSSRDNSCLCVVEPRNCFEVRYSWKGGLRNPPSPSIPNPQPSTPTPHSSTLNHHFSTLTPQPSTLNPQPSTLNPLPSTLHPQPSTLNPQTSTINPCLSTLNPQPSTLHPPPSTINHQPLTRAEFLEASASVERNAPTHGVWASKSGESRLKLRQLGVSCGYSP